MHAIDGGRLAGLSGVRGLIAGPAGAASCCVVALAAIWLAWASYRLKMAAWWGILVYWIALTVSSMLTFCIRTRSKRCTGR